MIKLYGTLGPACGKAEILSKMLENGMNGVRLNLSHGSIESFSEWLSELRIAEKLTGKNAEILIDTQGPEIRTQNANKIVLKEGETVVLGKDIPLKNDILSRLREGMVCSLDDGKIELCIGKDLYSKIINIHIHPSIDCIKLNCV